MKVQKIIQHRINTVAGLEQVDSQFGVECDIRAYQDKLVLHHEAFVEGDSFEEYLKKLAGRSIILNTKCEGLEEEILKLLVENAVEDYFFLDLSLPFLVKYAKKGMKNIAIRYSEFEPLEFVKRFEGLVDWVWIDCFTKFPLDEASYAYLSAHFKTCLVSPELQGHSLHQFQEFTSSIRNFSFDAVCTKQPHLWK